MTGGRLRSCECGECKKCRGRLATARWMAKKTPEEQRAIIERRDPEKVRANNRADYRRNKEKRLAAMKAYREANPEKVAERRRRWKQEHPDRVAAARRAWVARNPEKRRAQVVVAKAVKDGRLERGFCARASAECGGRIEAHHEDYSKPLEVKWLCRRHHGECHRRRYCEIAAVT